MKDAVAKLRNVALAEAVSYLVLLGIAMPLKYLANLPVAVSIVGAIHGALFVVLVLLLLYVHWKARWPVSRSALIFVASLIPFLPFYLDSRMRQWVRTAEG